VNEAALAPLRAATQGWRPWALLVLLCLGLFLPGIAAMPPLDRDEARFMQASRQMVETGDLLDIRFQDEARNKKPAGIYWLQSAAVALFSSPESNAAWPYRLPSLLGAGAAVLLTFGFGAPLIGREAALLGAALLASSVLLVSEAHLAKTDATLLATIVAAQGALGLVYRAGREGGRARPALALIFWAALGLGILVKGPVAPLVAALTILALVIADRRWHWLAGLRAHWGLPLATALVLPWFMAIESATQGGFAREALGHDLLGKLVGAQESHGAPPGAYLLLLPVTFWPGSALLGFGWIAGWRRRMAMPERFLLAWIVPAWLVFELVPTKLPHYVLPLYPAIALLVGAALAGAPGSLLPARRRGLDIAAYACWVAAGAVLLVALVALPIMVGRGPSVLSLVPAAAILSFGLVLLRRLWPGFGPGAAGAVAATALLVFPPSFAGILPALDGLWLSRSAAALVARQSPPAGAVIDTVGYNEPSLVFLLGGRTRAVAPAQAAADLAGAPGRLALVAGGDEGTFRAALAAKGGAAVKLGEASGIDYSRGGKRMSLALYAARAG